MIKYFTVKNFRSIKEESILDFDAGLDKFGGFAANPVIGVAGANASGKTALLQSLAFVLWFMTKSFLSLGEEQDIPFNPFYGMETEKTKFHLIFSKKSDFEGKEKEIIYEYKLKLTKEGVIYEELNHYPLKRKRNIYIRHKDIVTFGASVKKISVEDLRPNCSIISFASQFSSQKAAIECKNYLFHPNLGYSKNKEYKFHPYVLSEILEGDEEIATAIQDFIKVADIGIESVYLKPVGIIDADDFEKKDEVQLIIKSLKTVNPEAANAFKNIGNRLNESFKRIISDRKTVFFKHKIGYETAEFPLTWKAPARCNFWPF